MKKIIALVLGSALLLSGCGKSGSSMYSNYRETEYLQPVQTLGADTSEAGIRLSVSCLKPGQEAPSGIISREADTILRALDSLQSYSADRELYYAHAQYLLLGEDYAKSDGEQMLDFVARDSQLRLGLYLFVVRGSAEELVSGPGEESYELSKTLSGIRRDTETTGLSHVYTCRSTIRSLSRHGAALVCALSPVDTEGSVFISKGGISAVANGYGILKDGRLVGYIERSEAPAAGLLSGNFGSAGLSLPDGDGGEIGLEFSGGKAKLKALRSESGELEGISVEAKLQAEIAEPHGGIGHITDSGLMSKLEKALGDAMKEKMQSVLKLSQELNADFLGLGAYLKKSEKAEENWLQSLTFSVNCEAEINYSRELADKMGTSGGGS